MTLALDRTAFLDLQRRLAPRPRALPTCLILCADLALVCVAAWLATRPHGTTLAASVALFTLALLHGYLIHHECVHRAVFVHDRYNLALGELLGFFLVYPFRARRRSHMLHHAWAGHLERDPTNARARARLSKLSARQLQLVELLWRSWFPFLALNERIGLWRSALSAEGPRAAGSERFYARAALCAYLIALVASALFPGLRALLASYLLALFLLFACEELVNLPHHVEAPTVSHKLALWQQGQVTHSCQHVPVWSSLILLHFNLHTAHHLFPGLPWYRLPEAERALAQRHAVDTRGRELAVSVRLRHARFADVFAPYLRREDL